MSLDIRHASTFFKSFVYKVHATWSLCVPQSLRNSAIAFKHTCIKLEQITNLWVIAIKVLCDSICQRCTGLFNFKNPFDWINICEKCRWMKSIIVYMYFLHVIVLFFFCTFSHVRKYKYIVLETSFEIQCNWTLDYNHTNRQDKETWMTYKSMRTCFERGWVGGVLFSKCLLMHILYTAKAKMWI